MKQTEIKNLIAQAIEKERDFIDHCNTSSQSENPQVIKMALIAQGRLDALVDVHNAMTGRDVIGLRIMAKK